MGEVDHPARHDRHDPGRRGTWAAGTPLDQHARTASAATSSGLIERAQVVEPSSLRTRSGGDGRTSRCRPGRRRLWCRTAVISGSTAASVLQSMLIRQSGNASKRSASSGIGSLPSTRAVDTSCQPQRADPPRSAAGARQVVVVERDEHAVGGDLHVGLEVAVAERDRAARTPAWCSRASRRRRHDGRTGSATGDRGTGGVQGPTAASAQYHPAVEPMGDSPPVGSDRATGRRPVLVLQQPLVELAGRVAGEFVAEVDRARALHVGELRAAELRSARARAPAAASASAGISTGCTTALTSSPKSSLGTPNTATSTTFGWVDEHVLGLLRVDVHAAGDDHVRLAVGEVEEAVVVEVADVAERRPALRVARALRLLRVVVVLELAAALEVDGARLADAAARRRRRRQMWSVQPIGVPTVPSWASHISLLQ